MERDFKGVWIPKEIWLNKDLGWSEKLLLVEIDSLSKNGQCFASNDYFAKFLGCHKKHVSRLVSNLADLGLISVELIYKANSKQIDKRIIHVTSGNKNVPTPTQECSYPGNENVPTPGNKNVEDNSFITNTVITNTVINTINNKKTKQKKSEPGQFETEFESLWKKYPRKMGKAKALQAYIKARKVKKETYENILQGLNRYIDYVESRDIEEQYIMHGSTWFTGSKWLDEFTCIAPKKKVQSFMDFYKANFGGEASEYRGDNQIIDHDTVYLP